MSCKTLFVRPEIYKKSGRNAHWTCADSYIKYSDLIGARHG